MKGTFDNENIRFRVGFNYYNDKESNFPFTLDFKDFYGLSISSYMKEFGISSIRLESKRFGCNDFDKKEIVEEAKFDFISATDEDLTFEDAIERHLVNPKNFEKFNDIEKNHALCFLERYCMNYENTAEVKKQYVKVK